MMKKYIAVAAASLIGLAGVATAADALSHSKPAPKAEQMRQGAPRMHQKGELPRELQELNLSSKQKAEIQKIMESNRPQQADKAPTREAAEAERAKFMQKMQQRRAAEQNLITGKHFDEAAARRLVNERDLEQEQEMAKRKQQMADREVQHLKMRHDIFQVLTAKQQKQLLDKQQQRQKEREARMEKRAQPAPEMNGEPRPDAPPPAPQD